MEKIIVAPQIVIYKNAFKNSKGLVNLLENDSPDSLFSSKNDWYGQGFRKYSFFNKKIDLNIEKTAYCKEEAKYIKEICDLFDFIKKDYLNDFGKEKGIWPNIISWDSIEKDNDFVSIDYFKYDVNAYLNHAKDKIQEYHVDDYLLDIDVSANRHAVTINYYLNDEYDGGEICAYDSISEKSYKYKPSPGDIVVMPSTKPFYHAVRHFTNFDRYFLRIFIDYHVNGTENVEEFNKKYNDYINNHLQTIEIFSKEEVVK